MSVFSTKKTWSITECFKSDHRITSLKFEYTNGQVTCQHEERIYLCKSRNFLNWVKIIEE